MIEALVRASVRHRVWVLGLTGVLAVLAVVYGRQLELDALPDITGNTVVVLTGAPGFAPEEVEQLVTRPIETALGAIPGLEGQRSVSRYGISSITAIFEPGVDQYLARQLVQEKLNGLEGTLPRGVETPALGPLSGGLGEVYQFLLRSPTRGLAELLELANYRLSPLIRTIPGVVEVNTWGGYQRTLDVVADPTRLAALGLTLEDLRVGLEGALEARAGATLEEGSGQVILRAAGRPESAEALADRVLVAHPDGERTPVRLGDVARIETGHLTRLGAATVDGEGETVYVMVQMIRGGNALALTRRLHERLPELKAVLPKDVEIDVVYDRSVLVLDTVKTVFTNLSEGGLLVIVVLFLLLGSFRAGAIVAASIPLAMLGAVAGMRFLDVPGNLMSLGAIDFGLLVDGAVVMVEACFHRYAERRDRSGAAPSMERVVAETAPEVARPVFFSVLIILIVYVPVLSLTGVDGRLFRPMAITVILALATALVGALTFVPAATSLLLSGRHVPRREPMLVRAAHRVYRPALTWAVGRPVPVVAGFAGLLAVGGGAFWASGSAFVPTLDEGDLVIQTTRRPDISLEGAVEGATRLERALLDAIPEVRRVASRIGSPAVATDIMGLEQADVFVALAPKPEWRPDLDKDELVDEMGQVLAKRDPGANPSFTQPIQMRFNELLGGETADVSVSVFGPELDELRAIAERIAPRLEGVEGAEDVRINTPPDVALLEVEPRSLATEQAGLSYREVLDGVQAIRRGVDLGLTWDGRVPIPIRLRLQSDPSTQGLERARLPLPGGATAPFARVARLDRSPTPSLISHEDGLRRVVVGFNVREVPLGEAVDAAMAAVAEVELPEGYRLVWGGQHETLKEARQRLALVIPIALALVFTLLLFALRDLPAAVLVLLVVPFACVGGILSLFARGLPISISAGIGFIALSGIAVMNGVVLMTRLLENLEAGHPPRRAALEAGESRMRPVLMTALVAALGFVPMALATGVGAEVQRPLATVVVGGLVTSTLLTLFLLPTLTAGLQRLRRRRRSPSSPEGQSGSPEGAPEKEVDRTREES